MKKEESFKIEGYEKPIVVKELTIKQILSFFTQEDSTISFESLLDEQFLPSACNLTLEEIQEFTPGEMMQVWEKFKSVNKAFFLIVQTKGIDQILNKVKNTFLEDFLIQFSNLSNPVIQK